MPVALRVYIPGIAKPLSMVGLTDALLREQSLHTEWHPPCEWKRKTRRAFDEAFNSEIIAALEAKTRNAPFEGASKGGVCRGLVPVRLVIDADRSPT